MKYIACTSFSPKGYEVYGKKFLETFLEFWPIDIAVFYEGQKPDISDSRIIYHDLLEDMEFRAFQDEYGYFSGKDYRFMATKFSPKVFAKTSIRPECDWYIWVDADVVTTRKIDERFFNETCPGGFTGAYLGRKDWDTSECGFVPYNLNLGGGEFLDKFRRIYTTGELFSLPQWHDSFVFDHLREQNVNLWFKNLSENVSGNHVWPNTILGEYMIHNKGPVAKVEHYGEYA